MVDDTKVAGTITEVSTLTDLKALLEAHEHLVLFFLGGGCPHSVNYLPIIQKVVNSFSGKNVHFAKVTWPHVGGDASDIPQEMHDLIDQYQICAVPTTMFFKGKNVQSGRIGMPLEEQLSLSINELMA